MGVMRPSTSVTLGLFVSSLAFFPGPSSTFDQDSGGVRTETIDSLAQMIHTFVQNGWIVGAEFLVIHRGEVLRHEGFGWRDSETEVPLEVGTIFNIRSMTKPLVGAIVQRLADAEVLDLDDPVSRFLPGFAEGESAKITIRHLLTQTSGLPDGNPAGRPSDYPTLRSIADYWGAHGPTISSPGVGFEYSDPGADVLGAVLEVATGLSLDSLAQREVFQPLGMVDAFALIGREGSSDPRFCSLYQPSDGGNWRRIWKPGDGSISPFTIGSGTTWYTTPGDYARFVSAWLANGMVGDGRWLSEAAVERALEPGPVMSYANQIPSTEVHYGQMWQVYVDPDDAGESRVVAFGHSGSDGTYAWAWPNQGLVILYFTQSRGQRTRLLLEQRFGELF